MDKKALAVTFIIALLVSTVIELSVMQFASANFFQKPHQPAFKSPLMDKSKEPI